MLNISNVNERTAYVADPLPEFDVRIEVAGSVPSEEPLPFAVDHDDLRFLLATRTSLSRCLPANTTKARWATWDMPMGYTQLLLCEKRAVAWRGELIRLWPGPEWGYEGSVIVPDADGSPFQLGLTYPYWSAVENTVRLSGLTQGAALLLRVVDQQSWH
ncbi:MAG TPA: hypothetical protein PLL50_12135 [Propionicimonas sp.]|nr:hypothetical protein [Propionicimonas sp.]